MTKHALDVHHQRIEATLSVLRDGQAHSFYDACVLAGEQEGVRYNTVHTSWKYATPAQKLAREQLDPRHRVRNERLAMLEKTLNRGRCASYDQACEEVGAYYGVDKRAIRQMAERMPDNHQIWTAILENYPHTYS